MPRNERGITSLQIILIVAAVLAVLVVVWALRRHDAVSRPAPAAAGALSPEQKAYASTLAFADLKMSAAANFLGNTVTYLDGTVTNNGTQTVRRLDVELNFVDMLNQVVLRETAHPLSGRSAPLAPGQSQGFRVAFEHMPMDWNQAPPSVKVLHVEF